MLRPLPLPAHCPVRFAFPRHPDRLARPTRLTVSDILRAANLPIPTHQRSRVDDSSVQAYAKLHADAGLTLSKPATGVWPLLKTRGGELAYMQGWHRVDAVMANFLTRTRPLRDAHAANLQRPQSAHTPHASAASSGSMRSYQRIRASFNRTQV